MPTASDARFFTGVTAFALIFCFFVHSHPTAVFISLETVNVLMLALTLVNRYIKDVYRERE